MSGLPRRVAKAALFGVCLLAVCPLILLDLLERRLTRSELMFVSCAQLLAMFPTPIGNYLRGAYYFGTLKRCSWQTHVGFGSIFTHRGASLGPLASMGAYCVIGHADIGAGVMMGSRVSIPSGKRQHLDENGVLNFETTRFDTVRIGSRTWVGEGAIIMADVGDRCIVSAGAVVSKSMPDDSLVAGNPARQIKSLAADVALTPE